MIAQQLAMLRLVNILKKIKNEIALSNFSFQVKTGELAVLIGPSGCGKSTLLKRIADP